jgi:hypothetical protein
VRYELGDMEEEQLSSQEMSIPNQTKQRVEISPFDPPYATTCDSI